MIATEALAIGYGICSAITWGAGDFSGALATQRGNVLRVIFFSQVIGALLLSLLLISFETGMPSPGCFIWGGLAGISGILGLVALYKGLAVGRMGIVAPISAVVTALLPIVVGLFIDGLPKTSQIFGFAIALLAVWFLSAAGNMSSAIKSQWVLAVLAGIGFGGFFVCIDHVADQSIFWPLVGARIASVSLMGSILITRGQMAFPKRSQWLHIFLAGALDIAGNAFFALASQIGRLDISAILASMYPASTVLMARFFLNEHLSLRQWLGLTAALMALALISA